jgi:hypothetical protein
MLAANNKHTKIPAIDFIGFSLRMCADFHKWVLNYPTRLNLPEAAGRRANPKAVSADPVAYFVLDQKFKSCATKNRRL